MALQNIVGTQSPVHSLATISLLLFSKSTATAETVVADAKDRWQQICKKSCGPGHEKTYRDADLRDNGLKNLLF